MSTSTASTLQLFRPIVICGPSGVGKGTLIQKLFKEYPNIFGFSVSHTTRGPRPGEENGVHYYFSTKEIMQKEIDEGKFIEHANVHGNLYGTSFQAVKEVQTKGKCCVLDIDIQGARQVRNNKELNPLVLFVKPPSMDILEQRLRGRATETEESIQLRLKNARKELEEFEQDNTNLFDDSVENNDLDESYASLKLTIKKHIPTIQL
ncbi:guanylate kinase [Naegleria gruberi]|uniref:guanylate kinase n=1 Tax=Naegleria gruberi TaxID=5762 RepID=D2V2T6_NAEGR|nr:guanylate kinase [Naegleria gruberi]EFC49116.1 guanylate kinase [Naegleria gruberi]|eukprot:XP_002681860.1 guanylate kinase [Naegleria gruberi strain NEG-M]